MTWTVLRSPRMGGPIAIDDRMKARDAHDLVALSRFNAIRFQNDKGEVVHQYDLPGDYVLKDYTKHYFRFFEDGPSIAVAYTLKFSFSQIILNLIRSISSFRNSCSILDIGSTIGETYYVLKEILRYENYPMNLEFVGLDMNSNCVSFARDLFINDRNFQSVVGEASDLGRFPDDTFDFVVSNGVHNHVEDQAKAMREAVRVARVAAVFQIMMTATDTPQHFRHTTKREAEFSYHAPTAKQMFSYFPDRERYFWYVPTTNTKKGVKFDDGRYFDLEQPEKIHWHMVIIGKQPVLSKGQ